MLHLKKINSGCNYDNDVVKIINDFDKKGDYLPIFTIKGFRDLLNLLVEEGYGSYTFTIGYDCNCAYTSPSDVVKFEDNHIRFQE